jgi:hypothetical protein
MDVVVPAEAVTLPDVEGGLLSDKTAYLHIWTFSLPSAAQARHLLLSELAQQAVRVIVDVRGNPGGSIENARIMASAFTHHDPLALLHGKSDDGALDSDHAVPLVNLPVIVLVDGGSASASELFAAALQDAHAAVIVGSRTAGDIGTAALYQLDDGSGLEITVAQLLRATGTPLDGIGVKPDIAAPLSAAALSAGHDSTLERALALPRNLASLPAAGPGLVGHWVESFVPNAPIWSGPDGRAVAFGTRPQWSFFLVVAPQQGPRLFVFDPSTQNYAWIDAADVGPSGGPAGGRTISAVATSLQRPVVLVYCRHGTLPRTPAAT